MRRGCVNGLSRVKLDPLYKVLYFVFKSNYNDALGIYNTTENRPDQPLRRCGVVGA